MSLYKRLLLLIALAFASIGSAQEMPEGRLMREQHSSGHRPSAG